MDIVPRHFFISKLLKESISLNKKHKLAGGNTSRVYKNGETVIRSHGAWSPTIHNLLLHLETVGFTDRDFYLDEVMYIKKHCKFWK